MKVSPYVDDPLRLQVGMLVIPCSPGDGLGESWAFGAVDDALGGLLQRLVQEEGFKGKDREALLLHTQDRIGPSRVLLVGLGEEQGAKRMRAAAATAARRAQSAKQGSLAFALPEQAGDELVRSVQHVVEGMLLGGYRFERYKKEQEGNEIADLKLVFSPRSALQSEGEALKQAIDRGSLLGGAVRYCRDLVNEPAGRLTPKELAQAARQLARDGELKVKVLGARDCAKLGMGCLLGVAAGSDSEPQLIHLTYGPPTAPQRNIALVGKGVTFDAGGLNIKTGKGMEAMKADMAGAATVLAVMKILAVLRPPVLVQAIVPAVENMPSGKALRPGDILTALDGTTVEVRNTDAEGRLILADALAYSVGLGVDEIVELSTLTGSCVVALGPSCAGAMSDDEALVERFLAAAGRSGERYWRLPLLRELQKEVEGDISDLQNGGSREGAAIQAGLFLKAFCRQVPFLHLDIAGPAMAEKETPLSRKGGTGFGVLSLAEYLAGTGPSA